jgi:polygalacturonase
LLDDLAFKGCATAPKSAAWGTQDGLEITGVTLLNSGFWTLHPTYCKNVHIHHMKIQAPDYLDPGGGAPNGDGMDIDSCQNVLIEHNVINAGDDVRTATFH